MRDVSPRTRSWAFAGVAYTFGLVMVGTTLPTPLYPEYEAQYGFGSFTTTVVYAVYAIGVLAALLLVGSASDVVGRRRMLAAGLAASALSAIVFLTDAGLPVLFVGRVLSGISAGIFTGTATVAMVELSRPERHRQASVLASAVNMLGLGCGPLLAGMLAAFAPAPLHLPYLMHLVLLVPAALAVWFLPETVEVTTRRLPRPQKPTVPASARAVFAPAAVVAFAAFAVFGLVTAIEPAFLGTLLHLPSPALAGTVVFAMFAASAVGQIALTPLTGRHALPVGCVILLAGLVGIGTALATRSFAVLVASTIVVGLGQGVTFSAGIAAVTQAAPVDQRAQTVSAFFIVAYTGLSLPVIAVGAAATIWGLQPAGVAFTAVMGLVTAGALVAVVRGRSRRPAGAPPRTGA